MKDLFELELPDIPPDSMIAVDTETSGLHVDDGARVSVVSVAWYDGGTTPGQTDFRYRQHGEPFVPDPRLRSQVFAFDQGWDTPLGPKDLRGFKGKGRKKRAPQASLFDDNIDAAPNLDPRFWPDLVEWLTQYCLVFQNAKFDLHIIATGLRGREHILTPDLSRSVSWDTQVVNPVLWPEFPTSLKPTAARLWGEEETELQKALQRWLEKNGMRYDLAPWSLLGPYAADDAEKTIRLYDVQQLVIDVGERAASPAVTREVCEREIDLAITLYRMERRGIGLDAEEMLKEADKLSRLVAEADWALRTEIQQQWPQRYPTANDVPQVTEHLMRRLWYGKPEDGDVGLGLFPSKMTDTGPSVAQDVVAELAQHGAPFARNYATLNTLETALSMWYLPWAKAAGPPQPQRHLDSQFRYPRLRTNYRQSRSHAEKGGTISGRLAVERIQLQALPHDYQLPPDVRTVRSFFKPDPGYELWEIDLSQAEYRTAAGVSRCQRMIERFEAGDDAHAATARLIWQIDESAAEWNQRRNVAKRLNFGMLYGAGAETTRQQIKIFTGVTVSSQEMQKWLDNYRATFPELGRAARRTQKIVERTRSLALAGGRERWFSYYEQEHKAFNQLIQGGVAEMMKVAMIEIEANIPDVLLLQIHDSVIVEPRQDEAEEVVQEVSKIMCDVFSAEFHAPFKCDAKMWH